MLSRRHHGHSAAAIALRKESAGRKRQFNAYKIMATTSIQYVVAIVLFISSALPTWASPERRNSCRKTKVAVLGAGVAGITAAVTSMPPVHSSCLTMH